ncbi:MAG TPA: ABC transporter ATP-binding protein [Verrucomicrobiae bacterium]|nr:ABC transporter ATP-binding protein [Verrucomicrobiae bacterium]
MGTAAAAIPILSVTGLRVHFPTRQALFGRSGPALKAVEDIRFSVQAGETVGLVGESGCGKTTLGRAVVRLLEPNSGSIRFEQQELTTLNGRALRARRRGFQIVFQDSLGALSPRFPVEDIVGEALDIHSLAPTEQARHARVLDLLVAVGLEPALAGRYPHQLSGGQRQRVGLARALAVEPKLLVLDEPLSALDMSVQAHILNLLQELQQRLGLAYLFISHDLAAVGYLSHRVLVMYLGRIVEEGDPQTLFAAPRHPYTQALLSAVPVVEPVLRGKRIVLSGDLPSAVNPPAGCPFHPRCPMAQSRRCQVELPVLREVGPGHSAACHLA